MKLPPFKRLLIGGLGWTLSLGVIVWVIFMMVSCRHAQRQESPALLPKKSQYPDLIAALPPDDGKTNFTFLVVGDSRSNIRISQKIFAAMKTEHPAFILHTGDLVATGLVSEFLSYQMPLTQILNPIPLIPVPGNHEAGPNHDFAAFRAQFGDDRFSFDYQSCRFVGVNNCDDEGISDSDLRFIDRELTRPGAHHRFVVLHTPPIFFETSAGPAFRRPRKEPRGFSHNLDSFQSLMIRHQVDCVFVGHDHGFADRYFGLVRYIITGGGGAPLHHFPWLTSKHHYIAVHISTAPPRFEVIWRDPNEWRRQPLTPPTPSWKNR